MPLLGLYLSAVCFLKANHIPITLPITNANLSSIWSPLVRLTALPGGRWMRFSAGPSHFGIQLENIYPRVNKARWGDWAAWLLPVFLHPWAERLWAPDAGVVLSDPLLHAETGKSIQEKMEGIKPTESASFLPANELTEEEKTLHAPRESPDFCRMDWGFHWRKHPEAGSLSIMRQWNVTTLVNTGSHSSCPFITSEYCLAV